MDQKVMLDQNKRRNRELEQIWLQWFLRVAI